MSYFSVNDLPVTDALPGVKRRAAYLEGVMLTFFDFEPGAVIPEHYHPHEQITWIVSGALAFVLDGEERVLRPGDGALIPPDVPHSAVVLDEPCRAIDAWHPIRQDYR